MPICDVLYIYKLYSAIGVSTWLLLSCDCLYLLLDEIVGFGIIFWSRRWQLERGIQVEDILNKAGL